MARTIGSDFSTQLSSSQTRPFYAVEFLYTQPLRVWTGYGEFSINAQTYLGLGNLLDISDVAESAETKATGLNIQVGGLNSDILSTSLTQTQQGIVVNVYFGVLTTTSNAIAIVDTPYQIFSGFIYSMVLEESGDSSTLTFTVENKLVTLERPIDRRYTDQDQQNLFIGDKGCEFVTSLQDKSVAWGAGVQLPAKTS